VSREEEKRSEWNGNRITSAIYKEQRNRKQERERERERESFEIKLRNNFYWIALLHEHEVKGTHKRP
jgi:hypothetical protein